MAHTKHGPFVYACNRHSWGSPNGSGEHYGFNLFSLRFWGLAAPRKRGRPVGVRDRVDCPRQILKRQRGLK